MLALLLFAAHFSMTYPLEMTLSGLGQKAVRGGNAFSACECGWGPADKSLAQYSAN